MDFRDFIMIYLLFTLNLHERPLLWCCGLVLFQLSKLKLPLVFLLQVSQAYSVALNTSPCMSWSCGISSAHVAGGAGSPWQASRPWKPPSLPLLRPAKRTADRWMRATPPSNETSSSSCSTPPHRQSWPASSCWEAASRSILWSTGLKTDPLKLWRVWWMCRCWSTKVLSRSSTQFSTRWRRRGKWGFSWPNSSGQRSTGPGWRWASGSCVCSLVRTTLFSHIRPCRARVLYMELSGVVSRDSASSPPCLEHDRDTWSASLCRSGLLHLGYTRRTLRGLLLPEMLKGVLLSFTI